MNELESRLIQQSLMPALLTVCTITMGWWGPQYGMADCPNEVIHQEESKGPASDRRYEVTFSHGDIRLVADFYLPEGEGPFPGVVIVHGSGSSDRTNPWTKAYAEALVDRGIAVLHPDKRGSGDSGGDWRTASFQDLAGDAVAAAKFMRGHPKITANHVGLIGFSQGGHIVPAAAVQDEDIAFAISVSASVVPIMEQIGDELQKMGEREGLTEGQLQQIESIHQCGVRFALSGVNWDEYSAALEQALQDERLRDSETLSGFPVDRNAGAWQFLATIGDFDPMAYWPKLKTPLLFVYGGQDTQIDVPKSISEIHEQLDDDRHNYTLLFFSKNGHALYRADAMDLIGRWILDHGEH